MLNKEAAVHARQRRKVREVEQRRLTTSRYLSMFNILSVSYHYIMTVTLSLRRPNQILSTPQHKFPIESSQMNHKTAIRSFSEKFIKMPTDSHHNKMCDFQ